MTDEAWSEILSRLTSNAPVDLDDLLGAETESSPILENHGNAASPKLWVRPEDWGCIGVRVVSPPENLAEAARRLASVAIERNVTPIILSPLPSSGFERFGFRVEKIPEEPGEARDSCEAELQAFWDMPIIFDLEESAALG
ncbi:MAG: hypothetical protein ACR2OY_02685 [Boseongicola sp.]